MTEQKTYMVWARDRAAAIAKASQLATAAGLKVTGAKAEKFPGGAMYNVNWKVAVDVDQA